MSLTKFESMLKTNNIFFFDLVEFEEIIVHYLEAGKLSLAKKAVKLGLEQHPESVYLKLLHVEIYIFENELDKASTLLEKIELLDPNNEEVFIQKSIINSKSGEHNEAIVNLEKALIFTDDKVDVLSLIGMEYLYLENYENARLSFEKCIEVNFEDYSSLYNIVYCFDMEQKHEESIVFIEKYLNNNPYCEVAWHQLGLQNFILKNFKKALSSFDYAVLIDESFIGGYIEKAKTLEELERYQEAIENYLITFELDDPTAYAYLRVGECYEKIQKFDAAISYYKKAVHEDPLLDKGWLLLTNIYYNDDNYQKASYYISKALKIDEDNLLYWRKYSDIKLKLNFYEEAVTGFENCLALNDNTFKVYIGLVDVLSFLGEFEKAIKVLERAQKIYKNIAEIEYRFAGIFFILNNEKYGFHHLIKAFKQDYDHHVILKEIYPTVFENEKVQKLIKNYKKATE
ncbi:Tetratricopeptide repeat-containing protein [Polaribacter sp. KT25b]|uniref:tetratricopeptide repeat protein n=1 Tax=Polaribacter sp. KT25b TaxID=1855336 RepID=UPI00087BE72F|nr:tetratricopeptide repeat protein [Polaribacter sp. KT25b]SDR77522.1 Tetratricopeptide repeat-containing protein [Polaribacter sp. KT25b]